MNACRAAERPTESSGGSPRAGQTARSKNAALRQNLCDHLAMHVGEAPVNAVMADSQPLVVNPQQIENRRVQIVAPRAIDGGLVGKVVALSVGRAGLNSRAG